MSPVYYVVIIEFYKPNNSMRIVPANRLLIQPTVQCKWIEQHNTIEFILDDVVQQRFQACWAGYCERNWQKPGEEATLANFLSSKIGRSFECHNDDAVFSLMAGADFIQHKYSSFHLKFQQPNLVWSIEHR